MSSKQQNVRVGVGVLVQDPSSPEKVFAGIRKGSHGAGTLALPGGHLEMYESWQDCAKREVLEEMNLILENIEFGHVTNDVMVAEGKHYVTLFLMGSCSGKPQNMEPHKCAGWKSYSWEELKQIQQQQQQQQSENTIRLFGPLNQLILDEPKAILDFLSSSQD